MGQRYGCPKKSFFLGSDFQENQSAHNEYDQSDRNDGFQFHA